MAPLTLIPPTPELTVFHDPRCPESEYALQALQLGCQRFDVRRVDLADFRPTPAELRDLAERLEGDSVEALVHHGQAYRALGLDLTDATTDAVVDVLTAHPELLATPLLDDGRATMVGQPRERSEAWAVTGHVTDARPTNLAQAA